VRIGPELAEAVGEEQQESQSENNVD